MKINYSKILTKITDPSVRDTLALAQKPGLISFAGGIPNPQTFPLTTLRQVTRLVLKKYSVEPFQYGPAEGIIELRRAIARRLTHQWQKQVTADNILITAGSQQALDLLAKIFIDPKDNVIVENPTYFVATYAFNAYQADYLTVPLDQNGLIVDQLEQLKKPVKLLYTIPTFQNPTGLTLSDDRRKQLIAWAKKTKTIIIEDNPYWTISFAQKTPQPLAAANHQGYVIYTSTFSKEVAPGLRIGYIVADKSIIAKATLARQGMDLCPNLLSQYILVEYLKSSIAKTQPQNISRFYQRSRDLMLAVLKKYAASNLSWTTPQGGLFIWLTLPSHLDAQQLYLKALKQNVAFIPGYIFYAKKPCLNTLRLSYATATRNQIKTGIKKLCHLIKS